MTVPQINMATEGPTVSRLVAGLWRLADWQLSQAELIEYIETCLALGITTFDHADIYGDYTCEELFGAALAAQPHLRQKMQLITKCGIRLVSENRPQHAMHDYDTSKAHIIASAEQSLKNLQTDYLDLLLIHRPDPLLDADEVAAAFEALKQAGKVRYFGVSNFTPRQFELLASRLDFPLVTNQVEISLLQMATLTDGTLDQCQQLRIAPMAWSPLGGGRIFKGQDEQAVRLRHAMAGIGAELGEAGLDQVAFAWLLRHPAHILPIVGTGNLERLRTAAAAVNLSLSRTQWFSLWQAATGHEVP